MEEILQERAKRVSLPNDEQEQRKVLRRMYKESFGHKAPKGISTNYLRYILHF